MKARRATKRARKVAEQVIGHIRYAVDHVLRGSNSSHVVISPLLWQPSDGTASKAWYFIVATSEEGRGFRCDQFIIPFEDDREIYQAAFLAGLARRRPPLVVHVTEDELYMARLCEVLWPGNRISEICRNLEAEYAERAAAPDQGGQA
jgi:hypothetical protein